MRRRRDRNSRVYPPKPGPWNGMGQLSFTESTNGDVGWPAAQGLALRREPRRAWIPAELEEFMRRARAAGKSESLTQTAMRSLRSILKSAERRLQRPVSVAELFGDIELLAASACDDERLDGRDMGKLSYPTLARKRGSASATHRGPSRRCRCRPCGRAALPSCQRRTRVGGPRGSKL